MDHEPAFSDVDQNSECNEELGGRGPKGGTRAAQKWHGLLSWAIRHFAIILTCAFVTFPTGSAEKIKFEPDDLAAFVGGADVAAAQHTGHLESLLTAAFPKTRFRNFGWEGDTVFAQPRDFNFPPLVEHLHKARATVVILQFGRTEGLTEGSTGDFVTAYRKLLSEIAKVTPRIILVTPIPFEKAPVPLPDLSARNQSLQKIAEAIVQIGAEEKLPVVELFSALKKKGVEPMTDDGLQLSAFGQAVVAQFFAAEMGIPSVEAQPDGRWKDPKFESLRQEIIVKNRLWFNYWRPQNWAFLGGDRTEQPSSRDHRDPKVRWFPAEMEKFNALIQGEERKIFELAGKVGDGDSH